MSLVPVDPEAHLEPLWSASHDPVVADLWRFLFYGPFPDRQAFRSYLEERASAKSEIYYAVVDRESGRPGGIVSYLRMKPEHGVLEIGHIWFGVGIRRTPAATEAIFLLASHVFDDLGYRRLEWKCDADNAASRRAATRLGFSFEGIFPQHMIVKGRNRDTAWYALLDRDWHLVKEAFKRWLAADNFDAEGRQHLGLADIRNRLQEAWSSPANADLVIRDAAAADERAWNEMWAGYNAFYQASVSAVVSHDTWRRILDSSSPLGCLLAFDGSDAVGFANFVLHPYTWSACPRCLLEDLYVNPLARSKGVGRALICTLVDRAKLNGWTKVYWLTKQDNIRARRLYESITPADGFIQYTVETG